MKLLEGGLVERAEFGLSGGRLSRFLIGWSHDRWPVQPSVRLGVAFSTDQ